MPPNKKWAVSELLPEVLIMAYLILLSTTGKTRMSLPWSKFYAQGLEPPIPLQIKSVLYIVLLSIGVILLLGSIIPFVMTQVITLHEEL